MAINSSGCEQWQLESELVLCRSDQVWPMVWPLLIDAPCSYNSVFSPRVTPIIAGEPAERAIYLHRTKKHLNIHICFIMFPTVYQLLKSISVSNPGPRKAKAKAMKDEKKVEISIRSEKRTGNVYSLQTSLSFLWLHSGWKDQNKTWKLVFTRKTDRQFLKKK